LVLGPSLPAHPDLTFSSAFCEASAARLRRLFRPTSEESRHGMMVPFSKFPSEIPRWLKATVGLILLAALILNLDWSSLYDGMQRLHWPLIGAAALLYPLALLCNAWKWSAALRLHNLSCRFGYLLRVGCIGFFLNNLLPSAIGGDIYRVYRTSIAGATSRAISAVLLERVVGLSVLLLNGLIGALLLAASSSLARSYLVACLGILAVAALVALFVVTRRGSVASAVASARFLQPAVANIRLIARRHPAWPGLIAYSVAFQAVAAAVTYIVFAAVGADLTLSAALLINVAAGLAAILPISISGIGVMEGSIVGAGVALGVGYDAAFLAAMVLRVFSLITGLGCGVVYAFEGKERAMQTA
jgi:uncharacterized membrane protein YbhN (UPF0104 family)